MGIELQRGRDFNLADDLKAPPVCIFDDRFAEQQWPGENALGKRLNFDLPSTAGVQRSWWTVVGIAAHAQIYGAGRPSLPEAFVPFQPLPRNKGFSN